VGITVAAAGLGAAMVSATTTALSDVQHHEAGLTSGIINTFHEFGGAVGVAVISTIAAASLAPAAISVSGFTNAFAVSAITAAAAAVMSLVVVPAGRATAGMPVGMH
jgi:hypothetical protein